MRRMVSGAVLAMMVASVAMAAPPTPAASAKLFVDRLYGNAGPPVPDDRQYAPALAALVDRDAAIASEQDEPNLLDFDPLCDCQDSQGMVARVSVSQASATAATVAVRVSLPGKPTEPFLLKLVRVGGEWRIADILSGRDRGSLVAYLRQNPAR